MRFLLTLALLGLLFGCSNGSGADAHRTTDVRSQLGNNPTVSPAGTDVGASNPGINQGTTETTAGRANLPPP